MVDAFISIAIEKLVGLGEDELNLLCGTRNEVDKLSDTLRMIHPYLHDAEVRQVNEQEVGAWLTKLKYVAYEADDVLDEWQTKSHPQQSTRANPVWNFFAQCTYFHQLALRHTVGKKIQKINGNLDDIVTLSEKFNFCKSSSRGEETKFSSVIRNARKTTSLKDEIFGREVEVNHIKDELINSASSSEISKLAVVSILGPPGFGKTALAKHVFNDGEIVQHFKKRIWVCISDEFDVASIIKKIIEAVTEEAPSVVELETLHRKIVDVLKDKLFLLVLDDVWNEDGEKWVNFVGVIENCGLRGSRIVVTTRSEIVCKVVRSAQTFPVGIVKSFEHCWSIFESVAFGSKKINKCPKLREVGVEIVKKCKGVPLAIKTVAGVLRTESTREEWDYVLKSDIWEWHPKSEIGIWPALLLSYYHLSPPLKQCFRYCAIYPKDYVIRKDEIVPQWIAHGYVLEKKNMEMEDVGEKYFDELVARSLFQESELDVYNNITHSKMHDLVHDLVRFVTKGEFLLINDDENIEFDTQIPPLHCNVSNMELLCNIKIDVGKNLRSFISSPYKRKFCLHDRQIEKMQCLRVLELKNGSLEKLHIECKLVHLRYLSWQKFKALPGSIDKLQNLHYLDLSETSIKALPKSIEKLRMLRHLDLSYNLNFKALPSTIRRLTNLRKLDLKRTGLSEIPIGIGKLSLLRYLNLAGTEISGLPESIRDLSHLVVLDVSYCKQLGKPPTGIFNKMTGLKQLGIFNSSLRGLPAGIGKLTCLQRLDEFWVVGNHDGSSSSSSNIWELGDLNDLYGSLEIHNLDMVTSGEEATSAQLHNKNSLTSLTLKWGGDGRGGAKEKTSEDVLQHLRPCATLHELSIERYPGCTVPKWLGDSTTLMLSGLQNLYLSGWSACTDLPALGNLRELRRLEIVEMPKVRRVGAKWFGSHHCFPKLEYLRFGDMAEWEEWDSHVEKLFFTFPCLSQLEISDCPKLRSLSPIFSTTSLREINVCDCSNLHNWLGILPPSIVTLRFISAEWVNEMPSLPNLELLDISGDDGVSDLSNHLVELTALKRLYIEDCPNLESLPQEMASLKQLQKLEISNCPKLKESCNKEGAQWYKIEHIPNIRIHDEDVRRNA